MGYLTQKKTFTWAISCKRVLSDTRTCLSLTLLGRLADPRGRRHRIFLHPHPQGLTDVAPHVIEYHVTQETRVQNACR